MISIRIQTLLQKFDQHIEVLNDLGKRTDSAFLKFSIIDAKTDFRNAEKDLRTTLDTFLERLEACQDISDEKKNISQVKKIEGKIKVAHLNAKPLTNIVLGKMCDAVGGPHVLESIFKLYPVLVRCVTGLPIHRDPSYIRKTYARLKGK